MAWSRGVLGSLIAFCAILSFKLVACGERLAEENHKASITTEEHVDESENKIATFALCVINAVAACRIWLL